MFFLLLSSTVLGQTLEVMPTSKCSDSKRREKEVKQVVKEEEDEEGEKKEVEKR